MATAVPQIDGLEKASKILVDTFLFGDQSLVSLILQKGYLDLSGRFGAPEHFESAMILLSKMALTFPQELSELWSDELNQSLMQLMLPMKSNSAPK